MNVQDSVLQYLNKILVGKREKQEEYGLGSYLPKPEKYQEKTKPKKGGINDPLTEQRALTAKFLNKPLLQVARLTKGFSADELYQLRKRSESWNKNPQALWWKLFKELKHGKRKNQTNFLGIREERGQGNQSKNGDCPLFPNW